MASGRTIICAHEFPEDLVWERVEGRASETADSNEEDDLEEGGEDDLDEDDVPPGRVIAEAVRKILQDKGYESPEPEIDEEHCSWSLFPEKDGKSYYVQVWAVDELIVSIDTQPNGCLGFFAAPFRKVPPELPQYLFDSFSADPRFGGVAWQD